MSQIYVTRMTMIQRQVSNITSDVTHDVISTVTSPHPYVLRGTMVVVSNRGPENHHLPLEAITPDPNTTDPERQLLFGWWGAKIMQIRSLWHMLVTHMFHLPV